jgi:VWFA-related protein
LELNMVDISLGLDQLRRRICFAGITITMLAVSTRSSVAQEVKQASPDATPFTLQVSSREVMLDVVVTDHHANVHNDLTREDFQITENGVPQVIDGFEPPSAHALPSVETAIRSTGDLESRAPQAPVNVIVLDELNTSFQDMAFARYALKKYLNAQVQGPPAPTMLLAVSFNKFTVLQDYTQDRNAILASLDHHLSSYPWNLQRGEGKIRTLTLSLGALEQIAQATAGHPGRKNLIWVGRGFPGIDLVTPSLGENAAAGIKSAMQQAVNMLHDSRITLYTIDPTILTSSLAVTTDADSVPGQASTPGAPVPDPFESYASFPTLAKESGGKAFYSRNDVDREIDESVRDGMNYYTISYRPTNQSDEGKAYRKIHIGFTHAGLHAAYRDGYFTKETAVPTRPGTRLSYDMDAAIESTLVYTGLSVVAEAKPDAKDTYLVGIPEHELEWSGERDGEAAKLILIAAALDGADRVLTRTTFNLTAHRPRTDPGGSTSEGLARSEVVLPAPAGAYRLRFVVRSIADGHMGTADLKVPGAPSPPRQKRQ